MIKNKKRLEHSVWRKLAKKLRRKRIRQALAEKRDEAEDAEHERRLQSPTYTAALEEQRRAEEFQIEEEERISKKNHAEWLRREAEAQRQFEELQKKLQLAREEHAKQNARIKQEWEAEQKRLRELKELKEKQEEEKRLQHQQLLENINDYVERGGDIPQQLLVPLETNPNKEVCPFFKKTGACRFGDTCSRNHVRPSVSKIILIPNFYSHYSLEQTTDNEYGNDSSLEFETHEMLRHFKEFFHDVLPEMEKYGNVRQFKVCCNQEAHLRGNVYVEYSDYREAMKSFKVFQGRWYGGKQLNVEFSNIESWKSAICGLFFKQRCPKGSSCNFLHVFRNPGNLFQNADKDLHRTPPRNNSDNCENGRNWRWSESPEPINYKENSHRKTRRRHREDSERSHRNGYDNHSYKRLRCRSKSKSPARRRSRSRRSPSGRKSKSKSPFRRRRSKSRSPSRRSSQISYNKCRSSRRLNSVSRRGHRSPSV